MPKHQVVDCNADAQSRRFLYELDQPIKAKIEAIAASYGAAKVEYSDKAEAQMKRYTEQGFHALPICMAKTQYS